MQFIFIKVYIKGSYDIQLDFKIIGFQRFRRSLRSTPEGQI